MLAKERRGIQRVRLEYAGDKDYDSAHGGGIAVRGILLGVCVLLAGCGPSIHNAVAKGDIETVKAMLAADHGACEARDRIGKTPMHFAITFARPEILAELIAAGCDVNAVDDTGMTPLHVAAFIDLPGAVPVLLAAGATIEAKDEFGDTPLHTAAMRGWTRSVEILLGAGAEVSVRNNEEMTPGELAEKYGQAETAEMLKLGN